MRNPPIPFAKSAAFAKGNWKTKRRVMRSFKMGEISGVDNPAQEGARVLMHKRFEQGDDDATLAFVKATFVEVLDQRMIDQRFCEAFYEATKSKWTLDDAFQTALKDGDQPAEETVREYVDAVTTLAQSAAAATRTLGKSADFSHTITSAVAEVSDQFTKGRKEPPMIKTLADLKAAIKNFDPNSATATIEASMIKSAAAILNAEGELPGDGALAKSAPVEDPAVATLKRENAILKMAPANKSYFDGLDATAQTAFLAKDAAGQAAEVEASKAADPVLYKCADGTEIRKSDGAAVLSLAKSNDTLRADLAKERGDNADAAFAKRAADEFGNLPTEGTIELLKAADAITDADKKKKMLDALRASNKAAAPKFQRIGGGGPVSKSGGADGGDAPEDRLDTLAKSHQAANSGMSFEKAYDAVLQTAEGRELYAEMVNGGE